MDVHPIRRPRHDAQWIATELTARRTPLPRQKGKGRVHENQKGFWYPKQLANMLRNRAYVGDLVWNKQTGGGYSEYDGEKVVQHDRKTTQRDHDADALVVIKGAHEAIVPRDQFERVQAAIVANKRRTTPKKADEADYLFTRMLVCSVCGTHMVGRPYQRPKKAGQIFEPTWKDPGRRFYMCGGYFRLGKSFCKAHTIPEAPLRERVVTAVEQFCRTWIDDYRAELAAEVEAARRIDPAIPARLRKQIAETEERVRVGEQNLFFEPRDTPERRARAERVRAELDRLAAEADDLRTQLAKLEDGTVLKEKEQSLRDTEELLWAVREALLGDDPAEVRRLLREVVSEIKLTFNYRVAGKRVLSSLRQAEVILRPQRVTTKLCASAT